MKILGLITDLLGIGGNWVKNKQEAKRLKQIQEHEIIKAETELLVSRIKSNLESDNQIDLITAQNKKYSFKDEVVTYLFLTPVFVATLSPFITLIFDLDIDFNEILKESYYSLNELPEFYKYILYAVIIDVLGFRSFARELISKISIKK
jgi:hypothetical protein